jgi:hypothetical protein
MPIPFIALAGLATSAVSTGASFIQASKQKKMQQKAEREADKALADARKKLDVNFYEGLSLQKEPYERAREAMLASGQQALQAAQEGDTRGAAATAGRVAMAQGASQRDIAGAQAERLLGLEKLAAGEEARLAGLQADISLEEVAGKQLQAREAEQRKQLASQQALAGVGSMIQQGAALAPLFGSAPDTFDPSQATFKETQMTFNPELAAMQTTIDPSGRISPGVRMPTANFGIESVGFDMTQPGVTVNPFVIPQR